MTGTPSWTPSGGGGGPIRTLVALSPFTQQGLFPFKGFDSICCPRGSPLRAPPIVQTGPTVLNARFPNPSSRGRGGGREGDEYRGRCIHDLQSSPSRSDAADPEDSLDFPSDLPSATPAEDSPLLREGYHLEFKRPSPLSFAPMIMSSKKSSKDGESPGAVQHPA